MLHALRDGRQVSLQQLRDELADHLQLSAADRTALLNADGRETRLGNRVGHARTLLVRLGLAEQPARGAVQITTAGQAVLAGDRTPRTGDKDATSAGLYRRLDEVEVVAPDPEPVEWSVDIDVDDAPDYPPEPGAPLVPGPRALGRSIVLLSDDPIPDAWAGMPEIAVTNADLAERTATVDRLHREWSRRQPLVIRLLVDADELKRPVAWTKPLWQLGARFDPWTDRLLFLVWNNGYDGRGGRDPQWHWTTLAGRAGATPTPHGPADVRLADGEAAWVDGGPRRPFAKGAFGDQRVVHYLSVQTGSLHAAPPLTEPHADLAADQLAAVRHVSGPARVIAPAGSGKTRVLTERLRHLIVDRQYPREQVVAVAYNKRAQEEMVRRTSDFAPRVQTLNSLGWEILREAQPDVQLVESKKRELLEKHCPPLDHRANTDPLAPYLDALSNTRQALLDPSDIETRYTDIPGFADAFHGYRSDLIANNLADFDEQLYRTCELLLADPTLRRRWQARCRHLLVDEFQDLTPLHVLMLRTLGSPALDVFGTGDDDQVIYGYAGADPRFLIDFPELFPGAAAHALEVNYRCTPAIVTTAATLLTHNRVRVRKQISAARSRDSASSFTVLEPSNEATAATITAVINDWINDGCAASEIAVLCRVNAGLLTPQVALHSAGVAVLNGVTGDHLRRTGVAAAFAYLRLALSPGAMDSADVAEACRRSSRGIRYEVVTQIRGRRTWTPAQLRALAGSAPEKGTGRLFGLIDNLRDIQRAASRGDTATALEAIRNAGLERAMSKLDAKSLGESHIDDLDALARLAPLHPDARTFEAWLRDELARPSHRGGVTLATVHKVKGEEWNRVLVIDVCEGILPHRLADNAEEERRILHVAITRGRDQVVVLTDRTRPSRFIEELRVPWTERRAPSRERRASAKQRDTRPTITATEGLSLEANGGFQGRIIAIDATGVAIETSLGARLRLRFGERVKIDGNLLVLTGPQA